MLREHEPFREGKRSRLDGWEIEPKKLWFPYFPEKGGESPLFAHVIAFEHIRRGLAVPKDVSDVMEFHAKRDVGGIQIAVKRWNFLAMTGRGLASERILNEFVKSIAYTFGDFVKDKCKTRSKLIHGALAFESSIFSSVSVN